MKTAFRFFLIVITAFWALRCAQNGHDDQTINTGGLKTSNPAPTGTVDGGGGAGIDGKPIESYIRQIQDLPEYKSNLAPILAAIGHIHPEYQNVFLYIVKNRNWIFLDKPIQNLGADRQGTPLNVDQWAAQDAKEIWLSKEYAGKDADKAKILLHEILVGIKILKYLSYNEQCTAQFGPGNCQNTNSEALIKDYKLNALDHEDVRKTTDWLFNNYSSMTAEEFGQKMHEGQFQSNNISFKKYLPLTMAQKTVDFTTLIKNLTGQTFTHLYSDFDMNHVATATCKLTVAAKDKSLTIDVDVMDAKSNKILRHSTTYAEIPAGTMTASLAAKDANTVYSYRFGQTSIDFSKEDDLPVALSGKNFDCHRFPIEFPDNYDAWSEMRADDRSLLEKKYFGGDLKDVAAKLMQQHPDWK